jgi:type IV pilus assembly protein PilW
MRVNIQHKRQRGLTLVELLIGLSVGVIVIGGAVSVYASSVRSSNETLKSSRLNQELAGLMLVIANDVRRAGYWEFGALPAFQLNPFNQVNATALVVMDDMTSNTMQAATGQGSCLTYAYDATYLAGNNPGVIDSTDLFGFRLNNGVVQMRQSGVVDGAACVGGSCQSCQNGSWANVTDPDLVEVTALNFDLTNSVCLNASEPDLVDDNTDGVVDEDAEADCYVTIPVAGDGDVTSEAREILVTVNARLANDISTRAVVSQTILVRNDLIRIR